MSSASGVVQVCEKQDLEEQLKQLDDELNGRDLQERGRILVDVINYLEEGEEGAEGEEGNEQEQSQPRGGGGAGPAQEDGPGVDEPYPGEEGLEKLWNEVGRIAAQSSNARQLHMESRQLPS